MGCGSVTGNVWRTVCKAVDVKGIPPDFRLILFIEAHIKKSGRGLAADRSTRCIVYGYRSRLRAEGIRLHRGGQDPLVTLGREFPVYPSPLRAGDPDY